MVFKPQYKRGKILIGKESFVFENLNEYYRYMLKPNFTRKRIGKNYAIGFGWGNDYFQTTGNQGVVELLVNGLSILFVPHLKGKEYSFPPSKETLKLIRTQIRDFKNVDERRVYSLFQADVIIYEDTSRAGAVEQVNYLQTAKWAQSEELRRTIFRIDSQTFKQLCVEIKSVMPFVQGGMDIGTIAHRNDVLDLKFIQWLDRNLSLHKDKLDLEVLERLEL